MTFRKVTRNTCCLISHSDVFRFLFPLMYDKEKQQILTCEKLETRIFYLLTCCCSSTKHLSTSTKSLQWIIQCNQNVVSRRIKQTKLCAWLTTTESWKVILLKKEQTDRVSVPAHSPCGTSWRGRRDIWGWRSRGRARWCPSRWSRTEADWALNSHTETEWDCGPDNTTWTQRHRLDYRRLGFWRRSDGLYIIEHKSFSDLYCVWRLSWYQNVKLW